MTWLGILTSHICNEQGIWSNLNSVTEERVWFVGERKTKGKKLNMSNKTLFLINSVNPEPFQAACHKLLRHG